MFLKKELAWVRQGPRAQRSKQKDRFERYYDEAAKSGPVIEEDVELVIPPPPQLGNRTVDVTDLGMTIGGKKLFSGFTFSFANGQRIGVCGRNGLGKTTLLKAIIGQLPPTEGTVKTGQLTKFNYVDQGRLQLNEDRTVLDEVADGTEFVQWGDAKISVRSYLKRFLFSDDRILTLVKKLSGGERSRLLLARILKSSGNFLILDEPTNDLDLPTSWRLRATARSPTASATTIIIWRRKKRPKQRRLGRAPPSLPRTRLKNQRRSPGMPQPGHPGRANCRSRKPANSKASKRRSTRSKPR
jgi:ATP-binding cassette subfamily F protein uup